MMDTPYLVYGMMFVPFMLVISYIVLVVVLCIDSQASDLEIYTIVISYMAIVMLSLVMTYIDWTPRETLIRLTNDSAFVKSNGDDILLISGCRLFMLSLLSPVAIHLFYLLSMWISKKICNRFGCYCKPNKILRSTCVLFLLLSTWYFATAVLGFKMTVVKPLSACVEGCTSGVKKTVELYKARASENEKAEERRRCKINAMRERYYNLTSEQFLKRDQ